MNIFVIIIFVLVFILSVVFFTRSKIVSAMTFFPNGLFLLGIILIFSALFLPKSYEKIADYSLRKAGILTSVRTIDNSIDTVKAPIGKVVETGEGVIDDVKNFFLSDDEEEENKIEKEAKENHNLIKENQLERTLYPKLTKSLGNFYQALAVFLGIFSLILAIYLGFILEGVKKTKNLEKRIEKLEKR